MYLCTPSANPLHTTAHLCTPLHTSAHLYTPLYTSAHLCTPLYASIHLCAPLHTSAHLRAPLHILLCATSARPVRPTDSNLTYHHDPPLCSTRCVVRFCIDATLRGFEVQTFKRHLTALLTTEMSLYGTVVRLVARRGALLSVHEVTWRGWCAVSC